MTDINKQIEEARDLLVCIIENPSSIIGRTEIGMIETSARLLTLNLLSSSWRKVSEELPEGDITILIQTKQGQRMAVYLHDGEWCIIGTNDLVDRGIIEFWKPID